jgi:hypothetical protein
LTWKAIIETNERLIAGLYDDLKRDGDQPKALWELSQKADELAAEFDVAMDKIDDNEGVEAIKEGDRIEKAWLELRGAILAKAGPHPGAFR